MSIDPEAGDIDLAFDQDRSAKFSRLAEGQKLARYVDPPPTPKPGDPEYPAFARNVIESAFLKDDLALSDTIGERTVLAWRITRELCRHLNLVSGGESLTTALIPTVSNLDPWSFPSLPPTYHPTSPHAKEILKCGVPEILGDLETFQEQIPDKQRWLTLGSDDVRGPGISPLPPQTLRTAPVFQFWLSQVQKISYFLNLTAGSTEAPDLAQVALPQLLLDTHNAWPSRTQIVAFEEILVNQAIEELANGSQWKAMRSLQTRFGLLPHERKSVIEMARATLLDLTVYDVEEARALMIVRLENFVDRSAKAFDLRAELAGMKQLALVQGLSRTEAGDLVSDFTEVVRSVSASSKKELPK
jgi:hypothetical protein